MASHSAKSSAATTKRTVEQSAGRRLRRSGRDVRLARQDIDVEVFRAAAVAAAVAYSRGSYVLGRSSRARAAHIAAGELRDLDPLSDDSRWILAELADSMRDVDGQGFTTAAWIDSVVRTSSVVTPEWVSRLYGSPVYVPRAMRGVRRSSNPLR